MPAGIDFNTATWLQVARWAQARLEVLRAANDALSDPAQTAFLRGQIALCKELIGLPVKEARLKEAESAHLAHSAANGWETS